APADLARRRGARMTWRSATRAIYLYQSFRRAVPPDGGIYGPQLLQQLGAGAEKGLSAENRRASARLIRRAACLRCRGPLPLRGLGDHLIPAAEGGPHSVENFLPLCPACNSRKGTDDLLVWWRIEHDLATLDLDALCVWARLRHRWADARGWLDRMPPEPV